MKTYCCKTEISIKVMLNGRWRHLRFEPLTLGGSRYTTADPKLQRAIESHYKFGTQITVMQEIEEEPAPVQTVEGPEMVFVDCMADAKEYLADRFGVSRTKLRTADQLYEEAKKHNVVLNIR